MAFIRSIPKHRSAKLSSMLKPCKAKPSETPSYPALPLVAPHVKAVHGEDDARAAGLLLQLLRLLLR